MNEDLCERCETNPVIDGDTYCQECLQSMAEALYERSLGEAFRGNEAAAYEAEQQYKAKRLK